MWPAYVELVRCGLFVFHLYILILKYIPNVHNTHYWLT